MKFTSGNESLSSGQTRASTKLEALLQRWLEAYREVRKALAKPDPHPLEAQSASDRELASITERSDALAATCERLLQDLDGSEAQAAEIRFVVHKHQATYPRIDPQSGAELSAGELVWELRRLIAWASGTLEDVAGTLETRAGELDERGRELLRDEAAALDDDVAALKTHLAGPVDWDAGLDHLLAGEVAPFDDPAADEDDADDD